MSPSILGLAAGLVALYLGADWLVRGGASLARARGISPLVIGLTLVSFGSSLPELVVSTIAAGHGRADLALGNVIGSNIANIALVLGLAALVRPLGVQRSLVAREIPAMIAAALLFLLLALDGGLGRSDALVLLAGFAAYVAVQLRQARTDERAHAVAIAVAGIEPEPGARRRDALFLLAGLGLLLLGAELAVDGAASLARRYGISEFTIGFTVVAVGTSLPELATSTVAALRGEAEIAVGNVVGSNIFNTLAILGAAAAVRPLPLAPALLGFELPFMLALSTALLPIAWTGLRVARREGALLMAGYAAFLFVLLARA